MLKPEPSLADYRKYVTLRIEGAEPFPHRHPAGESALPLVLGQLATAHHVNDIPLEHIIDIALKGEGRKLTHLRRRTCGTSHEMEVWKETKLAPGTILMPGA